MDTKCFGEIPGTEKQGDFHQSLVYQMNDASDGSDRTQNTGAKCYIRDLAYLRESQAFFQLILKQRLDRSIYNREGCCCKWFQQTEFGTELNSVNIIDHPHDAESTGFYNGDCMQQSTDRGGSNHGLRQPAVKWNQGGLDTQAGDHQEEDETQLGRVYIDIGCQHTAFRKSHRTNQCFKPGNSSQKCRSASESVGDVDTAGAHAVGCTPVNDQGVSRQRQHFIKHEKRHQIARQGNTDGGTYAQAKKSEKTAA